MNAIIPRQFQAVASTTKVFSRQRQRLVLWVVPLLLVLLFIGNVVNTEVVYQIVWNQQHSVVGLTGNWSDLYARWYGTRELLLHGRDPYSSQMIAEMQRGFFGRDPLPGETLPEVAVFAMPLYTVFILAPLVPLDFDTVMAITTYLLPACVALGAMLWMAALGLRTRRIKLEYLIIALLALAWPANQLLGDLQQLTGLVFLFIAGGVLLLARRRYAGAGVLLALSTIKFQESWLLIAMLLLWALCDWRERRAFVVGFGGTMAALVLGAMVLQPDWIMRFAASLARYTADTADWRKFTQVFPTWALAIGAAAIATGFAYMAWRVKKLASDDVQFIRVEAMALAAALILLPTQQDYEGVLLLPALLIILFNSAAPLAKNLRALRTGAIELMLAPCLLAAAAGLLELVGLPIHKIPDLIKVIPYGFFVFLPYIAFAALMPKIRSNKLDSLAPYSPSVARF